MPESPARLDELVRLSHWLGDAAQDCAILGEGNTSTRISESSFLVKASGMELATIEEAGFVEVDFDRAIDLLDKAVDDTTVTELLNAAKTDTESPLRPSVETSLHAICLSAPGIEFVGHSHPTAINAITCSMGFESLLTTPLFPDQIVVCGAHPLLIPYIDPGVPLAVELRSRMADYQQSYGHPPKAIYLQNHGFIALGKSVRQVQAITLMAIKAARILVGSIACGGAHPMSDANANRIDSRTDEHYRQRVIEATKLAGQ